MAKLSELTIENFRGAAGSLCIRFKGERLTVIFGENGTGKTTIVDAIDLIGNGAVGSIDYKSSTTASKHAPSLGRAAADIRVIAMQDGKSWTGTLTSNRVTVTPHPRPPVHVLRRVNVQRFIDAQPAGRYAEIKDLIGVDRIEAAERALTAAAKEADDRANTFIENRAVGTELLQSIWNEVGDHELDAESWARKEVSEQSETSVARDASLQTIQAALHRLEFNRGEYEQVLNTHDRAAQDLEDFEEDSGSQLDGEAYAAVNLSRMLQSVLGFLDQADAANTCPVCEQSIGLLDLQSQITLRLANYRVVQELDAKRLTLQRKQVDLERQLVAASTRFIESARTVVEHASGALIGSAVLRSVAGSHVDSVDDAIEISWHVQTVIQEIDDLQHVAAERKGQIASLRKAIAFIDAYLQNAKEATAIAMALRTAADLARKERLAFTQEILDDIADDANTLYEQIHPGEGLRLSRLAMDQKQRASLHQLASFGDRTDVPPQAYYSEAHLDTLGFCFWLANVRKRRGKDKPIVVIDDVFSSADSRHLQRIAGLLKSQSSEFGHVIVTTHNGLFRDHLKKVGSVQMLELDHRWNLNSGIRIHDGRLPVDELRAAVSADYFDRQVVGSKAGILLEEILDRLALQYRVKMARVLPPAYTLGDLLSDTKSLVKTLVVFAPDGTEHPAAIAIVEQLSAFDFIRNQVGAHFNPEGATISSSDVEAFGNLTIALYEALTCQVCGGLPATRYGNDHRCSCSKAPTVLRKAGS